MRSKLIAGAFFAGTALLAGAQARATPLNVTNATLNVYNAVTGGQFSATSTSDTQQALSSNTIVSGSCTSVNSHGSQSTNYCSSLTSDTTGNTYSGNLNFNDPGTAPINGYNANTIGAFLSSATPPGTPLGLSSTTLTTTLSQTNYARTTVLEFTFTLSSAISGITINHDDGVGLYLSSNLNNDLLPTASAAPTSSGHDTLASLAAGTYSLFYVEANGLPASLDFEYTPAVSTPEPASLALLGVALAGIGVLRRSRSA